MSLQPFEELELPVEPAPLLDRFTVTASQTKPDVGSEGIRSAYVEEAWLPYLGPSALLFARRCDAALATLQDGAKSVAVIVARWAEALGIDNEEVVAAKNRLVRFGLARWDAKSTVLDLHRHWPAVPAAITTPEHRSILLAISDLD